MRLVLFYHSLRSDWNHGNAHFLRGVATELRARGHDVRINEPRDAWSLQNLLAEHGEAPIAEFRAAYPGLESTQYDLATLDLDAALEGADLVLVHEWNDHDLVRRIGEHRSAHDHYRLLFHDTHHRSVTERDSMAAYDLRHYDGVLAFGGIIRDLYLREGWTRRAWTWHEAADTRVFTPDFRFSIFDFRLPETEEPSAGRAARQTGGESIAGAAVGPAAGENRKSKIENRKSGDLVWIGNWGDEERTEELHEFLLGPVKALGLRARVYGVRYPDHARRALEEAGIEYGGWLPNYRAPEVFAQFRVTVHVPRRPYVEALPGIPTIRVFEALACGIPLVSAPWCDAEGLFTVGRDFQMVRDGAEMTRALAGLLEDPAQARAQAERGLNTIRARHTCAHRVDELMDVYSQMT